MQTKLVAVTNPHIFLEDGTRHLTPEEFIVYIARVSNPSNQLNVETGAKLIKYLIENKHWSPLECVSCTFEIKTSRAIAAQILRHRSFTFQEFSQRYAKVENFEDIEFRLQAVENRQSSTEVIGGLQWLPEGYFSVWHGTTKNDIPTEIEEKRADWMYRVAVNLKDTVQLYEEGIRLGVAKECVRFILPQVAQTTLYMTGSVRSWIHMLQIRDDNHAQKEIQLIAKEIKKLFKEQCPIISKALEF